MTKINKDEVKEMFWKIGSLFGPLLGMSVFCFVGCNKEKFEKTTFQVIKIENCEYIEFRPNFRSPFFLHKGDCPNHDLSN